MFPPWLGLEDMRSLGFVGLDIEGGPVEVDSEVSNDIKMFERKLIESGMYICGKGEIE